MKPFLAFIAALLLSAGKWGADRFSLLVFIASALWYAYSGRGEAFYTMLVSFILFELRKIVRGR